MFIKFAHERSQNKHFLNSVQDCLDRFCAILKSQKQNILKNWMQKLDTFNNWRTWIRHKSKLCYICRNKLDYNYRNLAILKDQWHLTRKNHGAAHNIYILRYVISQEISIFMHNRSYYDFHLIIKKLAHKFENSDFNCSGESTEKYTFLCFNEYRCKYMKNKWRDCQIQDYQIQDEIYW